MNVNVIRKCLDELVKAEPRLDYLRGMLETLIELNETTYTTAGFVAPVVSTALPTVTITTTNSDTDPGTSRISAGPVGGL